MKTIDGLTLDLVAERIEELKSVFPEVFKDGKIDFDALQNILGEFVEDAQEKYSFTWAGKCDSIRLAQKRSTGTLRPCKEESVDFDNTQNLYIEGDNLEVLKLLSGSYMNQVKMIYIDPPYNTGSDFVYKDDFSDSIANYKQIIGEAAKSNPETAGRYHTNWLNMMLPRLKLARVLLKPDGVIFISIDDNEAANLKKLCDEVFGEDNFVAQLIWQRAFSPKNDARYISNSHDYVLMYVKSITEFNIGRLDRTEEANARYSNPDNDTRGDWMSSDISVKTYNAQYDFPITTPSGRLVEPPTGRCWRTNKEKIEELIADNRIWFGPDGNGTPRIKRFLNELKYEGMAPTSIMLHKEVGHSQEGSQEVTALLEAGAFDGPKPVRLLRRLMTLANLSKDDIVLDFFSGSATIAHAVMQLNAEDGGKRKFICVQIPELVDEKSEAYKAGYKNICEIGKERIRRAKKNIVEKSTLIITFKNQDAAYKYYIENTGRDMVLENNKITDYRYSRNVDYGFKVFKLDTSNLKKWNNAYTRDYEDLANRIREHYDYLTPDRTPVDMVYEIMLKYSLPLTLPVEEVVVADVTVYIISHLGNETTDPYKVSVCMQDDLTIEQMEALPALGARTLFFADRCFTDTNAMTNCNEILKKADQEMRLF